MQDNWKTANFLQNIEWLDKVQLSNLQVLFGDCRQPSKLDKFSQKSWKIGPFRYKAQLQIIPFYVVMRVSNMFCS